MVLAAFDVMDLLNIFYKRDGKDQPPEGGNQDGKFLRDRAAISKPQQHANGHNKGDGAAANVSHGKAPGADFVHSLIGGDISEEAVIK